MNAKEFIGQNIQKWRVHKEIKQETLAGELNISKATLSQIENGMTDFTVTRVEQIAEALEIDFIQLLSNPQQIVNVSGSSNSYNGNNGTQNNYIQEEIIKQMAEQLKMLSAQMQAKDTQIAELITVIRSK